MGQKLMDFTKELTAVDDKTFKLVLKEPYGLVLASLGKPSSNVPVHHAEAHGGHARRQERLRGDRLRSVPVRRGGIPAGPQGRLREEPGLRAAHRAAERMAGGKIVKLDRVEWIIITDAQTRCNALIKGEIDIIEQPPHDCIPVIEGIEGRAARRSEQARLSGMLRMNCLIRRSTTRRSRQAAMLAVNQQDYLDAQIGNPRSTRCCAGDVRLRHAATTTDAATARQATISRRRASS